MKLQLFSLLQSLCDFLIADLNRTVRHVQAVRVWAWHHATHENLRTCNERQTSRTRFV